MSPDLGPVLFHFHPSPSSAKALVLADTIRWKSRCMQLHESDSMLHLLTVRTKRPAKLRESLDLRILPGPLVVSPVTAPASLSLGYVIQVAAPSFTWVLRFSDEAAGKKVLTVFKIT